jgi:hypothetical protein
MVLISHVYAWYAVGLQGTWECLKGAFGVHWGMLRGSGVPMMAGWGWEHMHVPSLLSSIAM